ncbi:hypothetical protein [Mycobacterium timonense]|uniref:hypothetical protein n=1 Tax=Mycobacterium timonense TaxID=701043 RepID=UPI00142EE66E|nr:hypothetical protein [Mycobacterium timonense]
MRKLVATLMAVGALMLSGEATARATDQPPPPPSPAPDFYAPKCLSFDPGPPAHWNYLPCGWTTDGKRWIPPPP